MCGDKKQGHPYSKKQRIFESLITMLEKHEWKKKGVIKKAFLNVQYRMEEDMGELVNDTFYDGRIVSAKKGGHDNLFCHFVSGVTYDIDSSTCCEKEAVLALRYATTIKGKHRDSKVVILCYYYGQVMLIRQLMKRSQNGIVVCTLDSFQGLQAEYVIVSTCAQFSNMSQHVKNKERACVAASRAKLRLIILGKERTFLQNTFWAGMLKQMSTLTGNELSDVAVR